MTDGWDKAALSDEDIKAWNRAIASGDEVAISVLQSRLLNRIHAKIAAEDLEDQT